MKAGKYRTGVITSLDQVPEGFVQITTLVSENYPPAQKSRRKRILSDAHQLGYVRAVKLFRSASDHKTGPVFIDPVGAEEYIRWHEHRVEMARRQTEAVAAPEVDKPVGQPVHAAQELRELIDVTTRLISSIRDLQAAIELRSETSAAGGDE